MAAATGVNDRLGMAGPAADDAAAALAATATAGATCASAAVIPEKRPVPLEQYFKIGAPWAGKFSRWDEQGLPTHAADGEPVSKSMQKKVAKARFKHAAKLTKLTKRASETNPQPTVTMATSPTQPTAAGAAAATTARASTDPDPAALEIRNAFSALHTNTGSVHANEPPAGTTATTTAALAATADAASSASARHGAKKKRQRPRTRPKKLSALQHRAIECGF